MIRRLALKRVAIADELLQIAERLRPMLVAEARRQGKTWQESGSALGVSRQATWERYGRSKEA